MIELQQVLSNLNLLESSNGESGRFPNEIALPNGERITIWSGLPPLLEKFESDEVGLALVARSGAILSKWGLANRVRLLKTATNIHVSELGPLLNEAWDGVAGSTFFDGYRFFVGVPSQPDGPIPLLVINATDERLARRRAHLLSREAESLKKLGRVLNMNPSVEPLAYAAVHELASVNELAAAMLWIMRPEGKSLELIASTGLNRSATSILSRLNPESGPNSIAEVVAMSREPLVLPDVELHPLTREIEGKSCYLKPQAVAVWPLMASGRLIGLLELIGRSGDPIFEDQVDLFETLAEHLALALNTAILFESVEKLASHDSLTGIANHRTLFEFLHHRLAESQRSATEIGVMMIDVDHFRSFNEEEGHDAGDAALKIVGECLRSTVRPYDLAARYGGEEFTIILPGSGWQSTVQIAERVRERIASMTMETRTGRARQITVSIGCAVYPHTATDADSLLRAADMALYEAKRAGRNRIACYSGTFADSTEPETDILNTVWSWIPKEQRPAIEAHLTLMEPLLNAMAQAVGLSRNQHSMLRAIFALSRRPDAHDPNWASRLGSIYGGNEYRLLQPSLEALGERYDGAGPREIVGNRIPILARIVTVIDGFLNSGGAEFRTDPGKFDPELVGLLHTIDTAA